MRRIAALLTCLAVGITTTTTPLAGQVPGAPARARFVGPDWLIGGGVLRCNVNDRVQLILEATTARGGRVDLTRFRPTISSSDSNVVNAVVDENPASNQVLCAGNGRSEVTLNIGTLTLCIPVLSGTARTEGSTPCRSGFGMLATSSGEAPRAIAPAPPVRARFVGPDWLLGTGSLSCKPGSQWQLVLDVTTQKLQRADLSFYPPRVSSSEESVAKGVLDADPNSLQVHCAAEGRSDVTVRIGTVAICIPVIVSTEGAPAATASCTPASTPPTTSQQTASQPAGNQHAIAQATTLSRATLPGNASRAEDSAGGITTSIADAVPGDPAKDGFTPREAQRSLMQLQRTATGGFVLQPGYYAMNAQSYSVSIGGHAPAANTGYLDAPAIGSARDAVVATVQSSVQHPEIAQNDVQVIIWAIVSRSPLDSLDATRKAAAAKLLTPAQVTSVNDNTVQSQPMSVLTASASLRRTLHAGSYAALQAIAVPTGNANPVAGSTVIPAGRWSLHPDGYYVRYQPAGFATTKVEIWVPQGSVAVGKTFDAATHVAVPGDAGTQALIMSGRLASGSP